MSRHVHLIGSVPLSNEREVFTVISRELGPYISRIPDGETKERSDWITWLEPVFANHEAFEPSGELFQLHSAMQKRDRRYRLKPGFAAERIMFDNILYGDIAIRSYSTFAELKQQGIVPNHCKFQVDLVPAHSVILLYVQEDLQRTIDKPFNEAVLREIDKIAAHIPHDQLSIQFDIASTVFARLERSEPSPYGRDKAEMRETFAGIAMRLANHVPPDVDLLFHFCYGDRAHKHVVEPTDMGDMVEFANRLARQVRRPIQLLHMPVPRDRSDDEYFAPLKGLQLSPQTEICLGLVHYTDGVDGTLARLRTARRHIENFAIATECGFGRRDPATIPELLRIHREVASTI